MRVFSKGVTRVIRRLKARSTPGVDPHMPDPAVAPSFKARLRPVGDPRYFAVDPANPSGVYLSPNAGGWETVTVTEHENQIDCDVLFGDAGVRLCVTPDGARQTRPGTADPGDWETFSIARQLNHDLMLINAYRDGALVAVYEAVAA